jgi:hypothetical protein
MLGRVHADDHDACGRPKAAEVADHVEAAGARKRDVEQDEIPLVGFETADGLFARVRFADEQVFERPGQDSADALTDDRVIVDEEYALHALRAPVPPGRAAAAPAARAWSPSQRYRARLLT